MKKRFMISFKKGLPVFIEETVDKGFIAVEEDDTVNVYSYQVKKRKEDHFLGDLVVKSGYCVKARISIKGYKDV